MKKLSIALENHHPDRKRQPTVKVEMLRKEHQKLHHKLPIDSPLAREVRQYTMLAKMLQVTKTWSIAYGKEFGENVSIDVAALTRAKRQKRKIIVEMIASERQKIRIGKGLCDVLLATILAFAHPSRFSSCRKFLHYCGYTGSAKLSKNYRRDVHSTGYEIVKYLIMAKDQKYHPLYLTIKHQLSTKHPEYLKCKVHGMAINRVGTLVFKEIYHSLHGAEKV